MSASTDCASSPSRSEKIIRRPLGEYPIVDMVGGHEILLKASFGNPRPTWSQWDRWRKPEANPPLKDTFRSETNLASIRVTLLVVE